MHAPTSAMCVRGCCVCMQVMRPAPPPHRRCENTHQARASPPNANNTARRCSNQCQCGPDSRIAFKPTPLVGDRRPDAQMLFLGLASDPRRKPHRQEGNGPPLAQGCSAEPSLCSASSHNPCGKGHRTMRRRYSPGLSSTAKGMPSIVLGPVSPALSASSASTASVSPPLDADAAAELRNEATSELEASLSSEPSPSSMASGMLCKSRDPEDWPTLLAGGKPRGSTMSSTTSAPSKAFGKGA